MPLALIYARSENYCIGCQNAVPWHLPNEFKHFMATTFGSAIVMGRRTYADHNSVLPGRINIVITRQDDWPLAPGVQRVRSLDAALRLAKQQREQVFVIGGTVFLRDALPLADTVYETVVHAQVEGDTFVDAFDFKDWASEAIENHAANGRHAHAFSIYRHSRRPSRNTH